MTNASYPANSKRTDREIALELWDPKGRFFNFYNSLPNTEDRNLLAEEVNKLLDQIQRVRAEGRREGFKTLQELGFSKHVFCTVCVSFGIPFQCDSICGNCGKPATREIYLKEDSREKEEG